MQSSGTGAFTCPDWQNARHKGKTRERINAAGYLLTRPRLFFVRCYYGQTVLISYIVGFALIQLALALVHTSNQSIIFRLRPDAKSRINAIYMTAYFIGGACGSALGIFAWNHGGWTMTCLAGLCLVLACMLFSLLDNLWELVVFRLLLLMQKSSLCK